MYLCSLLVRVFASSLSLRVVSFSFVCCRLCACALFAPSLLYSLSLYCSGDLRDLPPFPPLRSSSLYLTVAPSLPPPPPPSPSPAQSPSLSSSISLLLLNFPPSPPQSQEWPLQFCGLWTYLWLLKWTHLPDVWGCFPLWCLPHHTAQ